MNADPNLYDCHCNSTVPTSRPTQVSLDGHDDSDDWTDFFTSYLSDYPAAGILIILSPFLLGSFITYLYFRRVDIDSITDTGLEMDELIIDDSVIEDIENPHPNPNSNSNLSAAAA